MDRHELEAALEAVLFVAGEPVSRERLLELFEDLERAEVESALESVLQRYGGPSSGLQVDEVAGGLRLVTRPDVHDHLRRFFASGGGNKLSMAALETLAIIAYRQPVTGPEIQELRGVSPSGVIKTLLERHLVRIAGRKDVVGKPFLYCTTREFLVHFGLKSLKDLPPLEEFEETFGEELPPALAAVAGGELRPVDREELFARELAVLTEIDAAREEVES
ncbi:MAG: SMC-Scp complex subunit ScpB [Thermoanaerobaculia bacterium]|nr:SMC-Scp complex subunit ScpB [Thermoanaerobaculia bacterium]